MFEDTVPGARVADIRLVLYIFCILPRRAIAERRLVKKTVKNSPPISSAPEPLRHTEFHARGSWSHRRQTAKHQKKMQSMAHFWSFCGQLGVVRRNES